MAHINSKNLTVGYESKIIIENLNFSIEKGDYLCVVGENGAGKSTLIKTILGLKNPASGSIELGEGLVQKDIGYLPQQTIIQRDFPASVWEIIMSGCQGHLGFPAFYKKKSKEIARYAMEKMNIAQFKNRCYRELSGGQQQRVLLARALCAMSKMLILDEPVSGLDPKVTNELYETIHKLNKDDGITIIMISHDVGASIKYATHILHLGKKVFFGTKDEYLKSELGQAFKALDGGDSQ